MTVKNKQLPLWAIYGLPATLVFFLFFLINSPFYAANPSPLATAITLDLVISLPILYFILIRKTEIPRITVVSFFVIGMIIASWIIPIEDQYFLTSFKLVAIPIAEIGILSYLGFNLNKTYQEYKTTKGTTPDFFNALTEATQRSFPKQIGWLLATEIAVIYYAFFNWKKVLTTENEFTYHKKSGIILVLYAFSGLALVETGIAHILLERWNPTVALVLSLLGVYSCIQIFALIKSMDKRFIKIDKTEEKIFLRYGFFSETTIPIKSIEKIELTRRSLPEKEGMVQFSPLGILDTHNIILYLNTEQTLVGFYGRKKQFKTLAIYVDEKEAFSACLKTVLEIK